MKKKNETKIYKRIEQLKKDLEINKKFLDTKEDILLTRMIEKELEELKESHSSYFI